MSCASLHNLHGIVADGYKKHRVVYFTTVLSVGACVGLAAHRWTRRKNNKILTQQIMIELSKLVIDEEKNDQTFENLPFDISKETLNLLTSITYFHFKNTMLSQMDGWKLPPTSRAILLSSPQDSHHEVLAKALANYFRTKLLILDLDGFSSKVQNNYGINNNHRGAAKGSILFKIFSSFRNSNDASDLYFDEKVFWQSLHKVLVSLPKDKLIILYIRNVDRFSSKRYKFFLKMMKELKGFVLVLGSRKQELSTSDVDEEQLKLIFPYKVEVTEKSDGSTFYWNKYLIEDLDYYKFSMKEANCIVSKDDSKKNVGKDNAYENAIRKEIVSAKDIEVTFSDVGAPDELKELFQELIMLPLRRPNLFKDGLLKPCRGLLLFGPPGTGKTMFAKAIAKESNANFINISSSSILSRYWGDDEKTIRALFTLAAKVSPSIIFIDEVDSILGKRREDEHETLRSLKNEFMAHWDGLSTKSEQHILVVGATNRPYDLDDAIIRRFERRIMIGMPSKDTREKILRILLSKENVKDIDFKEIATMTEEYSGSDLKNLCVTAAYRRVRELVQQERTKKEFASATEEISLRSLTMEDIKHAMNQVKPSFSGEGMDELKKWNTLYGEGVAVRKSQSLSYFI